MQITAYNATQIDAAIIKATDILNKKNAVEITINNPSKHKTIKQLGFIFGGLIKALCNHHHEQEGEYVSIEHMKTHLYDVFKYNDNVQIFGRKTQVKKYTLSKMSKKQAATFINDVLRYCEFVGCFLPPDLHYSWLRTIDDGIIDQILSQKDIERSKEYLSYLRTQPCIVCGKTTCQPHHVRNDNAGLAYKPPDCYCVPLCYNHHDRIHKSPAEVENNIKWLVDKMELKTFAKILFYRWYSKK